MGAVDQQKYDHISNVRSKVKNLVDAYNELTLLRAQWDARGYSSTLTDADFLGGNEGLVKADIAAVYTSVEAIAALFAQGHLTNLSKVTV